jgi:SET domain-containing protein
MFYVSFCLDESPIRGQGVFSMQIIEEGQKVFMLDGPYVTWREAVALGRQDHVMPVGPKLYHLGSENFINHSCRPNLGFVDDKTAIALVKITPGTELTWDYSVLTVDNWSMACACSQPDCRKIISNYRDLPPDLKEKYKSITPPWVRAFNA